MNKCFSEKIEKPTSFMEVTRRNSLSTGNGPGERGCGLLLLRQSHPNIHQAPLKQFETSLSTATVSLD